MIIIDAIGKPCPIPVVEAKKALSANPDGRVSIKVDNDAAVQNLEKMANGLGYHFSFAQVSSGVFEVSIGGRRNAEGKPAASGPAPPQEAQGPGSRNQARGALTVAFSRDTMGEGAEELGKILIKGFIYALSQLEATPKHLIFFNSGAFLTSDASNAIEDLKNMENKGAKIMTCGTCVNYYNLPTPPAVGTVANMYDITETIANADKVMSI